MEAGTIAAWKVDEGAAYDAGDVLAEIETDKATVDFEAQDEGVAAKLLVEVGKEVKVGEPILVTCESEADAAKFADFTVDAAAAAPPEGAAQAATAAAAPQEPPQEAAPPETEANPFLLTPSARFVAHSRKIDVTGLAGSGKGGRITKGDVLLALRDGVQFPPLREQPAALKAAASPQADANAAAPTTTTTTTPPIPRAVPTATAAPVSSSPGGPTVPFGPPLLTPFDISSVPTTGAPYTDTPATTMRKVIAKRLAESRQTVPHAYASVRVDLGEVAKFRKALQAQFGVKVSVNDVVVKAVALALRDVPRANSSWIHGVPTPNETIDVSVAVATPTGLITPIVTNTAAKGLSTISAEIRDLAGRARDGKLKPHEFQGGTCSVSNLGMFGVTEFSAVINPPQACILAVGAGVPGWAVSPEDGAPPKKATTMTSRLSYDRRVVDEPTAAQFLQAFGYYMANPAILAL